jgi:hypothetical protein
MDPLNQNPVASGNQMPVSPPPEEPKSSIGPIAGAVIVIILLVAGGLYFWGAKLNIDVQNNNIPYIPGDDAMMEDTMQMESGSDVSAGFPPQTSSDEVSSIESDFDAINFEQFDSQNEAELNSI